MKIEFSFTICCQELQIAFIKREAAYEIDTDTKDVMVIDDRNEENPVKSKNCPYCKRDVNEYIDVNPI